MIVYPLLLTASHSQEDLLLAPILAQCNLLRDITFKDDVRPTMPVLAQTLGHQSRLIVEILFDNSSTLDPIAKRLRKAEVLKHHVYRAPPRGHVTEQTPLRITSTAENTRDGTIAVFHEAYHQMSIDPVSFTASCTPSCLSMIVRHRHTSEVLNSSASS